MIHPRELLSAHLDGELTGSERAAVERHVAECEDCAHEVNALSSVRKALRSLPQLEPPVPLLRPRSWLIIRWGAAAAAATLVVALAVAPGSDPAVLDLDMMADRHTARLVVDPGISTIRGPVGGR